MLSSLFLVLALTFAQAAVGTEADIGRVEALRSTSLSPGERRALFARWLPAYREHAAALAAGGRAGGAFDIAELAKTRTLQELTAVRPALAAARHPKLRELDEARTPSMEELRELLPPGAVYLSYLGNRGRHDGYITASEWPLYDLASDLAVISASNSGFGAVSNGEGLLGLPFALHVAGNRNAVLTLWVLNDAVTAALVERFFVRVRAGADHVTALAETKREFLSRSVHHWAPFVLYGS
ncbi:MAG: CHAT domain-containing protein [Pseudomonadota bacterium]|nr:CHAT domain-containing protein [Pseudomonadota bacterium]